MYIKFETKFIYRRKKDILRYVCTCTYICMTVCVHVHTYMYACMCVHVSYICMTVQWTHAYLNFFYVDTRIIQTPSFNCYVVKNCIILFYGDHVYDQLAMMAVSRNRKWKRVVLSIESKLSVVDSVAKELAALNCLKV